MSVAELFSVEGRVALITGGSKGLGKAMARALALAGADILIVSRGEEELAAALPEILDGTGRRGAYLQADLAQRAEATRVAEWALARFGAVDILVNNAGGNFPERTEEITDDAWDHVLGVHVSSAMALTRALVPGMKERGWGRVIYVSSILGFQGMEGRSAYSTAKSALQGLARSNAVDLGPHGITVNCIAPGAFDTAAVHRLSPEQRSAVDGRSALLRRARPDELAGPILLLASDAGSYITGTTLVVDGGWLAK
jgi:NAD(P)-dependent dehydrogenase (short-subunit alcohol dehydrogenase family)